MGSFQTSINAAGKRRATSAANSAHSPSISGVGGARQYWPLQTAGSRAQGGAKPIVNNGVTPRSNARS